MRRVAVNVVRDNHRQRVVREKTQPLLAAEPTIVEAPEPSNDLDDVLDSLPPQQRRAVDLYYGAGFSTEEAASRMAISPGAFRFHLSRARRAIKPRVVERIGRTEMAR